MGGSFVWSAIRVRRKLKGIDVEIKAIVVPASPVDVVKLVGLCPLAQSPGFRTLCWNRSMYHFSRSTISGGFPLASLPIDGPLLLRLVFDEDRRKVHRLQPEMPRRKSSLAKTDPTR